MEKDMRDFWDEMRDYYPELIDMMTAISRKSYMSVTDINTKKSWWSKRAYEFFNLEDTLTVFGDERVKIDIHPEDRENYVSSFRDRMQGIDIDVPIEYRVQTRAGHYDRFTATCRMLKNEAGENRFLIIHYNNHGVADEVDSVTGLHKEKTFINDLNDYISKRVPATILKIGINQFSRMNVIYGADYADAILNKVAQEIISQKTDKGFVYRMAGAKFVITYDDITDDEIQTIYNNIVEALTNNICIEGRRVPLKVSGGAVTLTEDMKDTNTIRSRLTFSLNVSRYNNQGQLVFFNKIAKSQGFDNINIISIIHKGAIDNFDGFYLCYQPIVASETGQIKGMEALLRWRKEPYGVVPPNVFIDWLEEDACMFDLGNWIIETALRDCKEISKQIPDFFVNVNVCPSQIEHKGFRNNLLRLVEESGLKPSQLCLELTERCRSLNLDFLKGEIEFFRANGIKIALDDFGTGSSSLEVMMAFPIDELKIDMSFIKDIQDKPLNQAMIRTVVDFSERLQLETCIEGVENQTVYNHLLRYGATWFQGYFFSRPVEFEEFKKLL